MAAHQAPPVPGILQARMLEWVAISFSSAWKWKVKVKTLSRIRLFATPWTAAYQAPPSMGFSRQEYWSGLPLPSPQWILLSHKKEWSSAICSNIDKPRNYYTEWVRQRQISYDITCMWNLKKLYKSTYLQNRNRFVDIENKFMVTVVDSRSWGREKLGVWD